MLASTWIWPACAASLLLLLFATTRWFARRVQALLFLLMGDSETAAYLYAALILPGTVLHESCHFIVARLLGVRTGSISLRPHAVSQEETAAGSIQVEDSGPGRRFLIGVAPLVGGTLAIGLLVRWRFGLLPANLSDPEHLVSHLLSSLLSPDALLWLYLMLAIGNAMLPSRSDRTGWRPALIVIGLGALALWTLSWRYVWIAEPLTAALGRGSRAVALAYLLTALLDVALGVLFWLLQQALSRLVGRRVEYA